MNDPRDFFENLVYEDLDQRRYTQQSPIMPDVWIRYGMKPHERHELLMVPNWHITPAYLASELEDSLEREARSGFDPKPWRRPQDKESKPLIAFNQNVVVASLWFDELVRVVLPLSYWWRRYILKPLNATGTPFAELAKKPAELRKILQAGLADGQFGPDVRWLTRVVGVLATIARLKKPKPLDDVKKDLNGLAKRVADLLVALPPWKERENDPVFSVNLNRDASVTLHDSVRAIKADAAQNLFNVRGDNIRWAVVDSGVDAGHPAFVDERGSRRVKATYDFVHIRELLAAKPRDLDDENKLSELRKLFPCLEDAAMVATLRLLLEERAAEKRRGAFVDRVIDWDHVEPFIKVTDADEGYVNSLHPHGTHVAGIIGADWRSDEDSSKTVFAGVAPAIQLYDLRVLDGKGEGKEFPIMSALQFVRHLNQRKGYVELHGVNLSFSIKHDVANYACGRTPVCDEAARLVASGVVVVAAAGNYGRARYLTPDGLDDEGFRTVSITDPGNADSVITVGATHRRDAHTYGVSYFSSRGPTGDGRIKPDLVAPGEKIRSTIPHKKYDRFDGTSMAAPHVSGAAALLLQRYSELIGQPAQVKEILCRTATDLGRERYFQGAGLLDILRALQSV